MRVTSIYPTVRLYRVKLDISLRVIRALNGRKNMKVRIETSSKETSTFHSH